ncbi:uncharacterized protein LOC130738726 [Lotus japonicus]|uniref:uncharacterized protein LOC130738726 n=1 Tax=Lotus japonicus TaxID=34305 RepID=UPI0025906745|nr:uncharacterized protein LOC130738726 [Lotus japonicus]
MELVNVIVDDEPSERKKTNLSEDDDDADVPVDVPAVDLDYDSETNVQEILSSEKKKYAGKRIRQNVPAVPIDHVSFHAEENVQKWKFVCQRIIAKEKEVGSDLLECKEMVALIEKAELMKTILKVGRRYERLVKEFLVNLSVEVGLPESFEFRNVYVRAKCVEFSPAVINKALGRSVVEFVDEELSLDVIVKELTAGQVKKRPFKKLLSTENLSVKYAILNKIGATLKHAYTCVVKLPISFPSLLTEIILQQHPQILRADEVVMSKGVPITLDHRLFLESHVPDIAMPSSRTYVPAPMTESGTKAIIAQEADGQGGEPSVAATAAQDASTEEEGESEESEDDTREESSSEEYFLCDFAAISLFWLYLCAICQICVKKGE